MTFKPKWTDNQLAKIAALRAEGKPVSQISIELGETFYSIQSAIRRNSILSGSNAGRPPIDTEKSDDPKEATERHVKDILRVHGPGKTWATHNIPAETARPLRNYWASGEALIGSPGGMCADLGVTA